MAPDIEDKIQQSFAAQRMMATLGARLDRIEAGRVAIRAPILDCAQQQHGFGHAGLTFSIGDSAAGYAALSVMPPDAEVMTVEMKINLLAPADGEQLRAVGEVVKAGRRLVVVKAEVFATKSDRTTGIALLQGTMIPL
ncbi:PaaI family thioesterase [Aliiruegeria haliotis]|uniref:PaaI family thioesterase n=1 Tax=Aliiruegeria haliotis TaxID=1280846 RepID=UPI000D05CD56